MYFEEYNKNNETQIQGHFLYSQRMRNNIPAGAILWLYFSNSK